MKKRGKGKGLDLAFGKDDEKKGAKKFGKGKKKGGRKGRRGY